jgi:hypothetical protein
VLEPDARVTAPEEDLPSRVWKSITPVLSPDTAVLTLTLVDRSDTVAPAPPSLEPVATRTPPLDFLAASPDEILIEPVSEFEEEPVDTST